MLKQFRAKVSKMAGFTNYNISPLMRGRKIKKPVSTGFLCLIFNLKPFL